MNMQYKLDHNFKNALQTRSPFPSCPMQKYIKIYLPRGIHLSDDRVDGKLSHKSLFALCLRDPKFIYIYIYIY